MKSFGRSIEIAIVTLMLASGLAAEESGQHASSPVAAISRSADDLYPGDEWLQYVNVADAGFSPEGLATAKRFWDRRDGSAFLAVAGGAVVASWGEVNRRFMCHSVRKSLLSALYGAYEDQVDLDLTLDDLGIDDAPSLTRQEKQARVVDLISSRSGVYHAAAAEPAEMSGNRPQRGSHPPGTHWWYNNWDFNTALVIFEQQTGEQIFQAFDRAIAEPLGMQDYRPTDGHYHFELDKSLHPAYPVRMSARDLARFGLLFARGGRWNDQQIIPADWVRLSTRAHSQKVFKGSGYGYMWWVEEPDWFTARGFGGHFLAVYPDRDLVMVIRTDTYHGRSLSTRACLRLFELVARAGHEKRAAEPELKEISKVEPQLRLPDLMSTAELQSYPCEMQLDSGRQVTVALVGDTLTIDFGSGLYQLWPRSETEFITEDSHDPVLFERDIEGQVTGIWTEPLCYLEATTAMKEGDLAGVLRWIEQAVEKFPNSARAHCTLAQVLHGTGDSDAALPHVRRALRIEPNLPSAKQLLWQIQLRRYRWLMSLGTAVLVLPLLVFVVRRRKRRIHMRRSNGDQEQ